MVVTYLILDLGRIETEC